MKFNQSNLKIFSFLILAFFLVIVVTGPAFGSFRRAPESRLYSLQGDTFQLDSSEKPIVVFFLSPQCLSCLPDLAGLKVLQETQLIDIVPICTGCDWKETRHFNDSINFDLEIFMGRVDLRPEWGIWAYPTLFLLDGNLRIVDKWEETIDLDVLAKQIEHINNPPSGRSRSRDNRSNTSPCTESVCY